MSSLVVNRLLFVVGDIGGTNARLRLYELLFFDDNRVATVAEKTQIKQINCADDSLVSLTVQFLQQDCQLSRKSGSRWPDYAVLAVAGPVEHNTCAMTNLVQKYGSKWHLNGDELSTQLGFPVVLINDFVAAGYGVLALEPNGSSAESEKVIALQEQPCRLGAPIACIGAGTGLGEVYLTYIEQSREYTAHASEGGHCDFAPRNRLEAGLLHFVERRVHQEKLEQKAYTLANVTTSLSDVALHSAAVEHVSVERVVSGMGLVAIFEYLQQLQQQQQQQQQPAKPGHVPLVDGFASLPTVSADLAKTLASTPRSEHPQVIAEFAKPRQMADGGAAVVGDVLAAKALDLFVQLYGAEAGNLALKTIPYGGLFVCGGVAEKVLWAVKKNNQFVHHFLAKGRDSIQQVLRGVPIYLVTNAHDIGLDGSRIRCLHLLRQHKPFAAAFSKIPLGIQIPQLPTPPLPPLVSEDDQHKIAAVVEEVYDTAITVTTLTS